MITAQLRTIAPFRVIAVLDPEGADVEGLLPTEGQINYPLLGLVDPYGTTYFSAYQSKAVVKELRQLAGERAHPLYAQLIRMAERCASLPHHFLVFIGD